MQNPFDWALLKKLHDQLDSGSAKAEANKEVVSKIQKVLDRFNLVQLKALKAIVGSEVETMAQSRENTEKYLTHPSGEFRMAALSLVLGRWGCRVQDINLYVKLAIEDSDFDVRLTSLTCLALCYRATKDERLVRLLAKIVRDESEPKSIRKEAYNCLSWTTRHSTRKGIHASHASLKFPNDIDWVFVDSFRVGEEEGGIAPRGNGGGEKGDSGEENGVGTRS